MKSTEIEQAQKLIRAAIARNLKQYDTSNTATLWAVLDIQQAMLSNQLRALDMMQTEFNSLTSFNPSFLRRHRECELNSYFEKHRALGKAHDNALDDAWKDKNAWIATS